MQRTATGMPTGARARCCSHASHTLKIGASWASVPNSLSESLLAQLTAADPDVPVTRIADAGHFPQEEAPAAIERALS